MRKDLPRALPRIRARPAGFFRRRPGGVGERSLTDRAFAVHFSKLSRWDPGSFHEIEWGWPDKVLAPISSVLIPRKEKVDRAATKFADLQPVTVHLNGTMSKRAVAPGREYSMDLWRARGGDFIVAKIDLKSGAVGIVPDGWGDVVVTGHFAVYVPDHSRLFPEFLHLLIQAPFFKELLWRNKVGAEGRKEVKLEFFEGLRVPIPPLAEQRAIVARWRDAQAAIAKARERIAAHEAGIPKIIYDGLGMLAPVPRTAARKLMVLRWTEVERWSFTYLDCSRAGLVGFTKSRFPIVRLGEHLEETMNGYCIKPVEIETPHRMLKLSALKREGLDFSETKFITVPDKIAERFSVRVDDVLICRSNSYEYVAKCSVATEDHPEILFPDIIIRARTAASLLPAFLGEVINTPVGRSYFQLNSRRAVGGMWKIGADDITDFPLPLPPLSEQRALVERVAAARAEIARERAEADRLAAAIAAETEALLLGTETPQK